MARFPKIVIVKFFLILSVTASVSMGSIDGGRWGVRESPSEKREERKREVVKFTRTDGSCSPMHQAAVFGSVTECQVRSTLVELPLPDTKAESGSILQLIPGHVMVDRCSGSCHSPSYTCLPTRTTNTTLQVMAIQTTYSSGVWNTLCTEITVEKHLSCACACRVSPGDCTPRQFYDSSTCQCRCRDQVARLECLSSGKIWNPDTCGCVCPQRTWRACSTGFTFDYVNQCDCVRTVGLAAQSGLTVLVGAFAISCLAISAAAFHFKRRRAAEERRRRLTDVMTEEASGAGGPAR